MKFLVALLGALSFSFLTLAPWAQAQDAPAAQNPRIALIIGNSAYPDHPLATPANDAGLVAQTLQAAGFEVVGARDLDQNSLRGALRDFLAKAATIGPDMQAFIYLAGRGVQYDGDNYFVPVDAQIARDADIPIQAIKISDFSHALGATPGRARIIVVDAARANSFAADGSALAGGLGLVDPEDGTLMAFNAAPGTVAPDEPGPYGVYGKSLAGAMRQGGLPIDDVFAQTRLQVNQQTSGGVVPWSVSKVQEPYSIFERAPDAPPPPAVAAVADAAQRPLNSIGPDEAYSVAVQRDTLQGYQDYLAAYPSSAQARRVRAILAARREASFWRRSVNDNSPRAYWTYLRVYPRGPHVPDAQRRLQILAAQSAPPPDFAPVEYADLPPPPPDELVYDTGPTYVFDSPDYGPPPPPPVYFLPEQDADWRDLPPPPPPVAAGFLPVLAVAIPLLIGAKVFHDHHGDHAQQNVGAPPAPPPLPHGFKPHDHAPGAPAPVGAAPAAPQPSNAVKPLPVVPGMGKPLPGAAGASPATQPLNTVKPLPGVQTPAGGGKPMPGTPAVAPGAQPLNEAKPLPGVQTPAGGGKPLPGTPAVAPGAQPSNEVKPLPGVQTPARGGKPLPGAPVVAPGAQPSNEAKPLPGVQTPAGGGKPLPGAPSVAPGAQPSNEVKPLPVVPGAGKPLPGAPGSERPGHSLEPGKQNALPTPAEPLAGKPEPHKELKTTPIEPKPAPQVLKPAPVEHAPPVQQHVTPPPPVQHVAPPPVQHVAPPAPVQHAPPPPAPAVQRAPPPPAPVQHAPPPPAPVQHAAPPPPAPVQHAAPPPQHAAPPRQPACGAPHTPPCPK
jgi:uncharacterized caspase-like protein